MSKLLHHPIPADSGHISFIVDSEGVIKWKIEEGFTSCSGVVKLELEEEGDLEEIIEQHPSRAESVSDGLLGQLELDEEFFPLDRVIDKLDMEEGFTAVATASHIVENSSISREMSSSSWTKFESCNNESVGALFLHCSFRGIWNPGGMVGRGRMGSADGGGWGKNPNYIFMVRTSSLHVSACVVLHENLTAPFIFPLVPSVGSTLDPHTILTEQAWVFLGCRIPIHRGSGRARGSHGGRSVFSRDHDAVQDGKTNPNFVVGRIRDHKSGAVGMIEFSAYLSHTVRLKHEEEEKGGCILGSSSEEDGKRGGKPALHIIVGIGRGYLSACVGKNDKGPCASPKFYPGFGVVSGRVHDPRVLPLPFGSHMHVSALPVPEKYAFYGFKIGPSFEISVGPVHGSVNGFLMQLNLDFTNLPIHAGTSFYQFGAQLFSIWKEKIQPWANYFYYVRKATPYIGFHQIFVDKEWIRYRNFQQEKVDCNVLCWKDKPPDTSLEDKTFSKAGVMIGIRYNRK